MNVGNVILLENESWQRLCDLADSPKTIKDTGLTERFLCELTAKHIYKDGLLDLKGLVHALALEWHVVEQILDYLRQESLVEIKGPAVDSSELRFCLTDKGKLYARDAIEKDGYIGYSPVTIDQYQKIIELQSVHRDLIKRESLVRSFSDVVIENELLDQLGAAINSSRAIFIYGPPGTGKSYLCGKLSDVISGNVLIPHAIYQSGTVIQLFDKSIHTELSYEHLGAKEIFNDKFDQRYVLCKRPVVVSGGELSIDQLEVQVDVYTKQFSAPLQIKANNGIYILDDLGRQKISTKDLFNRWIVPLETQTDYLNISNGQRIQIPFDVVLIFSTNLNPMELADDAFLRRIGHKIRFDHISKSSYIKIWKQVCDKYGVDCHSDDVDYIFEELYDKYELPKLPCHPRDLIEMALNFESYKNGVKKISKDGLHKAWENYFIRFNDDNYNKSAYTLNEGGSDG